MARRHRFFRPDEALKHPDHHRPVTRRELLSQGFRAGGATLLGTSLLSLLGHRAHAISPDLLDPTRLPAVISALFPGARFHLSALISPAAPILPDPMLLSVARVANATR